MAYLPRLSQDTNICKPGVLAWTCVELFRFVLKNKICSVTHQRTPGFLKTLDVGLCRWAKRTHHCNNRDITTIRQIAEKQNEIRVHECMEVAVATFFRRNPFCSAEFACKSGSIHGSESKLLPAYVPRRLSITLRPPGSGSARSATEA